MQIVVSNCRGLGVGRVETKSKAAILFSLIEIVNVTVGRIYDSLSCTPNLLPFNLNFDEIISNLSSIFLS